MTPTTIKTTTTAAAAAAATGKTPRMSDASVRWDQAEIGFLTDAERLAKNMDVEGKGYLSREEAVAFGSQHLSLKEDNKQIKKQLYGLAILCVLMFIGTIAGTVMAVKNGKDTIVGMKTGVMKVNDGAVGGEDVVVTVKAQGTTFKTTASFEKEEDIIDSETKETSTVTVTSFCVSGEDVVRMWLANEQGTDARLVMLKEVDDDGTNEDDDTDTQTEIGHIQPITSGPALWKKDGIVMGGMIFTPNEECDDTVRRKRRMLLQENNGIEHDENKNKNKNDDMQSFDPMLIHRALKQRVDFLTGRQLSMNTRDGITTRDALDPTIRITSDPRIRIRILSIPTTIF